MPKLLMISPCQVNFGEGAGARHVDDAEVITVQVDTARALVAANRAMYADRKDDPSKGGRDTATDAMLQAAATVRKERTAAAKVGAE